MINDISSWKNAIGFTFLRINRTGRSISAFREILFVGLMNTTKVCLTAMLKNTALKCWFGAPNSQQLLRQLLSRRKSRNGNDCGKLNLLKNPIQNGPIFTTPLTSKMNRHSGKFSFRIAKQDERKIIRNPVCFFADRNQTGFRIFALGQRPRASCGMTVFVID